MLVTPARNERLKRLTASAVLLLQLQHSRDVVRARNKRRQRLDWNSHVNDIGDSLFKRAYRLTLPAFNALLEKIQDDLLTDYCKASNSSGSTVKPETCLAMALRFLAGGQHIDICFTHGVAVSTFYDKLWLTLEAINKVEHLSFPIDDLQKLQNISTKFQERTGSRFPGCVGAIDGISIRCREPFDSETPNASQYKNRKGFFSFNVQAISDADYIFTHASIETAGTTHDWMAWQCSPLFDLLEEKGLPPGFWIAGDDAYVCSEYLLTPYPGKKLGKTKDTFNFFQSSCRIHIEQAFGILVRRWGILWRRLECHMSKWSLIVMCCMKLHNICQRERIQFDYPMERMAQFGRQGATVGDNATFSDETEYVDSAYLTEIWENRHRHREQCALRDLLAAELSENGFVRPGYSNYSREG